MSSHSAIALIEEIRPLSNAKLDVQRIVNYPVELLTSWGLKGSELLYTKALLRGIAVVGLCLLVWWISRKLFVRFIHTFAKKTKTQWDDLLLEHHFFAALAYLVPLLLMDYFMGFVFRDFPKVAAVAIRLTDFVTIFVIIVIITRFLNTARDVLLATPKLKDKPIYSFFQLTKIVVSIVFGILMISVAFDVDLVVILTSMGAMTAVILLVFKDTILGFVGSIQLAANDMVRIGDWITMDKYGADGDVEKITLATVKVRNFDKTITTIPTYSFISDAFKNWRGMQESEGRRIARSIYIQIGSIGFCSEEMLERYQKVALVRDYIDQKETTIEQFNASREVDRSVPLNGRSQTNIGVFRQYMVSYLKQSHHINQSMTVMVRQLAPTEKGVPLQVYAFTKTKDWDRYEEVMSDIFDHLFAAAHYFDLTVFERPSGRDMKALMR